jgi:hypothetical protein
MGPDQGVAAPPGDADQEITLDGQLDPETGEFARGNGPQHCDYPVLLEVTGKSKVIDLGGGRFIVTSPNLKVVATNLDKPTNQESWI